MLKLRREMSTSLLTFLDSIYLCNDEHGIITISVYKARKTRGNEENERTKQNERMNITSVGNPGIKGLV
jgi:hypothetical protein